MWLLNGNISDFSFIVNKICSLVFRVLQLSRVVLHVATFNRFGADCI
jgi:hypothetical protein